MAQTAALLSGPPDNQAAPGGKPLLGRPGGRPGANPLGYRRPEGLGFHACLAQNLSGLTQGLVGQSQQQMLASHIGVTQLGGVLLGQPDGPQSCRCEAVVRHMHHLVKTFLSLCPFFRKFSIDFF